MKKRGLSDVVTTVLIILLVLAAVVIIWSFVKPAIQGGAGKVSAGCVELDLRVNSCAAGSAEVTGTCSNDATVSCTSTTAATACGSGNTCNGYVPAGSGNVVVSRGADGANLQNVVLVYDLASGESQTQEQGNLNALGQTTYPGVAPADAEKVTVTGRIQTEAGETQLCAPTAIKVDC